MKVNDKCCTSYFPFYLVTEDGQDGWVLEQRANGSGLLTVTADGKYVATLDVPAEWMAPLNRVLKVRAE